jgi:hypothetical protein
MIGHLLHYPQSSQKSGEVSRLPQHAGGIRELANAGQNVAESAAAVAELVGEMSYCMNPFTPLLRLIK